MIRRDLVLAFEACRFAALSGRSPAKPARAVLKTTYERGQF
jgi:hypothetical protein